ncbi:MAG: cache domain-containing protein [Spirochaetes bacterium]|nr:cache domain-containing protein [Spirochaetota bacterium]MBN2769888.1 cache domain-containing protein [Spirochaetota bacterium]
MKYILLFWHNLKLRYKIGALCVIIVSLISGAFFIYLIPTVEELCLQKKKEHIKDVVAIAVGMIEQTEQRYRKEGKDTVEAQQKALDLIRGLRYGQTKSDYVWINDYSPRMIMHPLVPDMDGMDVSDYKDKSGKLMFVEFAQICRDSGGGFTEYMWQYYDDENKIVPKMSYVEAFDKWGWVVGTGLYIEDIREEIAAIRYRMIALLIIISFVSVLMTVFIVRSVEGPVYKIMSRLDELSTSGGDLTIRFENPGRDEMGQMSEIVNRFLDQFAGIIGQIQLAAQNLATAVDQIASGNQNLSQRTSEQASSLEEIVATIEQTMVNLSEAADHAVQVILMSSESEKMAEEGGSLVGDAVTSINEISSVSDRIGEIIAVINDIAFQTNLLALNAAVEAARAGNQGRGFAVVAGEVRNLAQRSGTAAREIESLIKNSLDKINDGTKKANQSGEALSTIINSVKKVNTAIEHIVSSSEEQKQGITQINTAITEMDTMTQQNAALVEETASASEELANQARELLDVVGQFTVN